MLFRSTKYQEQLAKFESPMQERERLTIEQQRDEAIMLKIRLREGLALADLNLKQIEALRAFQDQVEFTESHATLTPAGRLIADRIVRTLVMA